MVTILSLGGNVQRVKRSLEILQKHPDSILIISSEGNVFECKKMIQQSGINFERVIFDFSSYDTLTNFTKTSRLIKKLKTKKLIVVTDYFHIRRAMMIARITLWPFNKLISITINNHIKKRDSSIIRDTIRAIIWKLFRVNVGFKRKVFNRLQQEKKIALDLNLNINN